MRIVVLGAGQVGGTLAYNLAHEDNDITLVDIHEDRLRDLQHRLDINTVLGSASYPSVLIEAGIQQADMLIAVTNSDEVNMIACQIAYSLFRTPTKIARIRSKHFYQFPDLFCAEHIPVDECIIPEQLVTEHIINLIDYPSTAQVLNFCNGRALLVTIKPQTGNLMIGKTIRQLNQQLDTITTGIVALFRENNAITLQEDTIVATHDDVLLIVAPETIHHMLIALGCYSQPNRRLLIAGGGHIGSILTKTLENRYRIKVIDHNAECANKLASQLHRSIVLLGDIADKDLLINENIEFTDVFCAVTNDDETNIMSCLQAKHLGARYAMALVNRNAYVDLIDESTIDHAISPQQITIGSILAKLRRGNMVKVHRLNHDQTEAIEIVVHGDELTSQVIGRRIQDLQLPRSCLIAAVVRENQLYIAGQNITLAADDHVILLLLKKRYIREVEALFQVNLAFMG